MKPGKAGVVKAEEVTNVAMVNGNEDKISCVIVDGVLKEWVGIGWIDVDDKPDPDRFPILESN